MQLKQKVYESIYARVANPDAELDFDLCHVNYDDFFSANTYQLRYKNITFQELDTLPTTEDVIDYTLEYFQQEKPEALADIDIFIENIEQTFIETTHDEPFFGTAGKIYAHLHGEVQLNNKTFFLVDKQWYLVKDSFIEVLQRDFDQYVSNSRILGMADVGLSAWATGREGAYNDSYCPNNNFIVGDRVILDGIEYFDLLYIGDPDKVYIIQVKKGFGGKTRESCSQIRNSAKMIESSAVADGHRKLVELYEKLASRTTATCPDRLHGISQTSFVNLFLNRERIYLLAVGGVNSRDVLIDTDSNIAKFEVLSTRDALRVIKESDSFRICLV